jgi:hypothetical protein
MPAAYAMRQLGQRSSHTRFAKGEKPGNTYGV